jgi:hypothetical protein
LIAVSVTRDGAESVAGLAFVSGTDREVLDDETQLDLNFDNKKKESWSHRGFRDWSSILSVVVCDTAAWIPIAVVNVTSNLAQPFWTHCSDRHKQELLKKLRDVWADATVVVNGSDFSAIDIFGLPK